MDESGDRGADEQGRRRRSDERLPPPGPTGGHRAVQMVEAAVAGFKVLHGAAHHPAQRVLVDVPTIAGA